MNFIQRLKLYNIVGFIASFIIVIMYLVPSLLSEKNSLLNFSGTVILLGYVIGVIELFRRVPNVFIQEEILNTNGNKDFNKPAIIKITEPIRDLVKEKNYFILNRVTTKIQINDTFLKLGYIDSSKIDGYPIFQVIDSSVRVNSAMNFEIVPEQKLLIANFINDNGYVILESDITGNFPSKDTKGNYITIKNGSVYYKTAELVRYIKDHASDYQPMNERVYQI